MELDFIEVMGYIFRGRFRWAVPHLQRGANMLGKKALQTAVNVGQNVNDGQNLRQSLKERGEQTLGLNSQNSWQSGAGRKGTKRKEQPRSKSSLPSKKVKTSPLQKTKPKGNFCLLSSK